MSQKQKIHILGGGPAGLSVGYYGKKKGKSISIHESSKYIGGNCRTIQIGDYRFDTGAHRFHDKISDVTNEIKQLMGDHLVEVHAPSKIYFNGKMIDFPLNFQSVIKSLELSKILKILFENAFNAFKYQGNYENFEQLAYAKYGKTLSDLFLINYTEKLWGTEANRLQTTISGDRLKHLSIYTIIFEMILKNFKSKHLEGAFYYPKFGYGTIFDKMANYIGFENIKLDSKIVRIIHDGNKIKEIEYENSNSSQVEYVINTLPITSIIKMMEPLPSDSLLQKAKSFKFRHLKLCILTLDIPFVSKNASIYFPEKSNPITRIYEPKNRSHRMAPEDKTSLVIEIPFTLGDNIDCMNDDEIIDMVKSTLTKKKLFKGSDVIGSKLFNIKNAYPILEIGQEKELRMLIDYLQSFKNHQLIGRNVEFKYLHTHHIIWKARKLIENLES